MRDLPVLHLMTAPGLDPRRDRLVKEWATTDKYSGEVCVHADREWRGVLWNHREIVRCMAHRAEPWSLVLQDDAEPYPGWEDALREIMRTATWPFVSLGHFSKYGVKPRERGFPYVEGVNVTWGQALLYRGDVLKEYLDIVEAAWEITESGEFNFQKWDDGLIAVYSLINGTTSAFTSRALIEHADWESTLGHVPGRWRRAESTLLDEGPPWDAVPSAGRGGPSVSPDQRKAAEIISRHLEGK